MTTHDDLTKRLAVAEAMHRTRASLVGEAFLLKAYDPTGGADDIDYCEAAADFITSTMDVLKTAHGEDLERMIRQDLAGVSSKITALSRSEWQLCLLALNEAAGWVIEVIDQHPEEMPEVEQKLERFRLAKQHLCRVEIRTILRATRRMCDSVGIPSSALLEFDPTKAMIEKTFDAARKVGVKESSLKRMMAEFAAGGDCDDE